MGVFQIIDQITLPEQQDIDAFAEFMRNEYFPAVHKGPTRVGEVLSLTLLQGISPTHEGTRTFLMQIGYAGLATGRARVDDDEVQRKFKSFGARIKHLGTYNAVAVWPEAAEA